MKLDLRSGGALALALGLVAGCLSGSEKSDESAPVLETWAQLSSGSAEATLSVQSDWKSGYCSDVTIKNSGTAAVSGWSVTLNLHQSQIASSYSAKRSGSTFSAESYNASIAPGSSVKFGFCANATGADYLATIATFSVAGGSNGGGSAGASGAGAGGAPSAGAPIAGAPSGGAAAAGAPSTGSGSGTATLLKTDEWNSGYCADVNVNAGSNWSVVLDMRGSAIDSGQLWSASYTTSGSLVTVTGSSTKFRLCARKTAASDWLATVKSVNGNGGGSTGSGGATGAAGASSGGGSAGSGGSSGGGSSSGGSCPAISGTPGWTSRYWDCCKPHCGWSSNVPGGAALSSCSASNQSLGSDYNVQSACAGGSAYMCQGLTPWAVSNTLAYGYAATPTGTNSCGKCYQVQFTGAGQFGADPGSSALAGKTLIVQSINVGGDVGQNQFDFMVPGGGVGLFNACSSQWGVSNAQLGEQYGGLLATCKKELGYNASGAQYQSCLRNKCTGLFTDARGLGQLREGCLFYVDWFQAADNPKMVYKEVSCPAAIVAKSNLRAGGSSNNACGG